MLLFAARSCLFLPKRRLPALSKRERGGIYIYAFMRKSRSFTAATGRRCRVGTTSFQKARRGFNSFPPKDEIVDTLRVGHARKVYALRLFVPPTGQKFRFGDRKVCSDFIDHHNNLRFVRLHAHDFICLTQLAERRTAVNALVRAIQGIEHAHVIVALLRVSALFGADAKQRKVIARKNRVVIIILLSGKIQNCRKIQPESL